MATPIVVAVIKTPVIMVTDGNGNDDVDYILSRAKVYRHGFMVISYSKLIKKQKQKKILNLD